MNLAVNVLLVYGGGSIKRIGLYDRIIKLLDDNGITYYDLSGVEPNPRVNTVEKGIKICRENSIDVSFTYRWRKQYRLWKGYSSRVLL